MTQAATLSVVIKFYTNFSKTVRGKQWTIPPLQPNGYSNQQNDLIVKKHRCYLQPNQKSDNRIIKEK